MQQKMTLRSHCCETMRKILLLPLALFISFTVKSQSISISTGLAPGANNPGNSFWFIPVEFQWHPFTDDIFSFVMDYDIGLHKKSAGEAYTTSPSLPGHVQVNERLRTNVLTVGLSLNVKLFQAQNKNLAELSIMPGYSIQQFRTFYQNFDQENYEILNQDVNRNSNGMVMAFGLRYRFNKNKILSVNIQTPLFKSSEKDFNYRYAAPARFIFGYQLKYRKNK
jgi:hypothetical protein